MVKQSALLFIAIVVVLLLFIGQARADLVNGDFSNDLNGWYSAGTTVSSDGIAVLSDSVTSLSYLYQPVAGITGAKYQYSFDIKTDSSIVVPDFSFPDTFFASLYFVDDKSSFDLSTPTTYDDALAILDADTWGVTVWDGEFSPIAGTVDWFRYSLTFQNEYNWIIPTFELLASNLIAGDSTVYIDNIALNETAPIPEPSTLLLFCSGLVGLAGLARSRNKINRQM